LFAASPPELLDVGNVPWPDLTLLREAIASGVVEVKALARMWHPDKFLQRFGDRLGEAGSAERELVMERVTEVATAVLNPKS